MVLLTKRSDLPPVSMEDYRRNGPQVDTLQGRVEYYWLAHRGRTLDRRVLSDGTYRISVYKTGYIGEGKYWGEALENFARECEIDGIVFDGT